MKEDETRVRKLLQKSKIPMLVPSELRKCQCDKILRWKSCCGELIKEFKMTYTLPPCLTGRMAGSHSPSWGAHWRTERVEQKSSLRYGELEAPVWHPFGEVLEKEVQSCSGERWWDGATDGDGGEPTEVVRTLTLEALPAVSQRAEWALCTSDCTAPWLTGRWPAPGASPGGIVQHGRRCKRQRRPGDTPTFKVWVEERTFQRSLRRNRKKAGKQRGSPGPRRPAEDTAGRRSHLVTHWGESRWNRAWGTVSPGGSYGKEQAVWDNGAKAWSWRAGTSALEGPGPGQARRRLGLCTSTQAGPTLSSSSPPTQVWKQKSKLFKRWTYTQTYLC